MRDPFLFSTEDGLDEMPQPRIQPAQPGEVPALAISARYWLYGTTDEPPQGVGPYSEYPASGFECYYSDDLENWSGPVSAFRRPEGFWADTQFWAPEVYCYGQKVYMFATMKKSGKGSFRGVVVLESESGRPEGPFVPISRGPITPSNWSCLDGTLYVENNTPYMVFCHEWTQLGDGKICCMELSKDLRSAKSPVTLFSASQAPWSKNLVSSSSSHQLNFITDGPYLHRCSLSNELIMLWSSIGQNDQYCVGIARSTSGDVTGPWVHDPKPLFENDGGHAMLCNIVFNRSPGQQPNKRASEHKLLVLALHSPNRQIRDSSPRLYGVLEARDETTGLVKLDWFDFLPSAPKRTGKMKAPVPSIR